MFTRTNEATRGRVSMAFEGTKSADYEREKLSLDGHAKWRDLNQKIVTPVTGTLRDAGILVLLVIFAAELLIRRPARRVILAAKEFPMQERTPPRGDVEQLRDHDDSAD